MAIGEDGSPRQGRAIEGIAHGAGQWTIVLSGNGQGRQEAPQEEDPEKGQAHHRLECKPKPADGELLGDGSPGCRRLAP